METTTDDRVRAFLVGFYFAAAAFEFAKLRRARCERAAEQAEALEPAEAIAHATIAPLVAAHVAIDPQHDAG